MAFKSTKGRTVSGSPLEVSSSDNIGLNVGVGGAAAAASGARNEDDLFFPPVSSVATLAKTLSCPDGKILFSTDDVTFAGVATVGIGETYFVGWASAIFDAAEGSRYDSQINVTYTGIGITEEQIVVIDSIDRVPSQERLTFTDLTAQGSDATVTAAPVAMLGTINAPTWLWGSSNSSNAQVSVGNTAFASIPDRPGIMRVDSKDNILVRHFTRTGSLTTTDTTINVGYSSDAGKFTSDTWRTTNESIGVQQPLITSPTDGSTNQTYWRTHIATSGYATIGAAGNLTSSRWEISTNSNFTSHKVNAVQNSSSTSITLPIDSLDPSTLYYVRVTFTSANGYSATSTVKSFTTGIRLFTYLDGNRTTYTLPNTVTSAHTIISLNMGQGNGGQSGVRGQGCSGGSPGSGGSQGTTRVSTSTVGGTTTLSQMSGGTNTTPVANGGQTGKVSQLKAHVLGVGTDGNNITVNDMFSDAINIYGGSAGSSGGSNGPNNGGGGGGGAGGIKMSYNSVDDPATWSQDGGNPGSYPTGATGGNNGATDNGQRRAYGGQGGQGWGSGAGGGAGGSEYNCGHGGPGGGGSPGGTGASIVLIV